MGNIEPDLIKTLTMFFSNLSTFLRCSFRSEKTAYNGSWFHSSEFHFFYYSHLTPLCIYFNDKMSTKIGKLPTLEFYKFSISTNMVHANRVLIQL